MRDRFKFRAWNKKEKKMYYQAEHTYDYMYGKPTIMHSCFGDVISDDDYVVEQCTGLKDKNGRLIYENDVVKITGDVMTIDPIYDNKLYVVNYSDLSFGFDMVGEEKGTLYCECWDYEVVGNIHQDSHLLEN